MVRRFWWLRLAAAGCLQQQVRSQKADEPEPTAEVRTVGDLTTVTNATAIPVIGIGLVTHLNNTGGGVPPGNERASSRTTSRSSKSPTSTNYSRRRRRRWCVSRRRFLRARKGDPVDIFVSVPDYSRTTSLRGGKLLACYLYSFENSATSASIRRDPIDSCVAIRWPRQKA